MARAALAADKEGFREGLRWRREARSSEKAAERPNLSGRKWWRGRLEGELVAVELSVVGASERSEAVDDQTTSNSSNSRGLLESETETRG